MKLELLIPTNILNCTGVESYFTEANRNKLNPGAPVNGLDLGVFSHGDREYIKKNYYQLFQQLNWDLDRLAIAEQVHGNHVIRVDEPGIYNQCDGFVTNMEELALGIQVADCAAVLLADPIKRVIAALHAGWRGAVSGIIENGIVEMKRLNGDPARMIAYISPCISMRSFEVGHEVAKLFPDQFCDYEQFDKPHVDLKAYITYQLIESGIPQSNIECATECTIENERFYSYRREQEHAGRMLALIKLAT